MFRKIPDLVKERGMEVTAKGFLEGQVHGMGILDSPRIGAIGMGGSQIGYGKPMIAGQEIGSIDG